MKTKDAIFAKLLASPGQFVSGQQLAATLGVSRAAVWKAVEQLKSEGVRIQAVTNRGYCLAENPDILTETALRNVLHTSCFGKNLHILPTVDSTNRYAKDLASGGAPEGTVVIAEEQHSGRGRMGKSFSSPKGGLYMSVILRPKLQMQDMMAVTACTASAVCLALLDLGILPSIKWVNDLFLNGRKICGILCEGSFQMENGLLDYLVAGIGINLHPIHSPELQNIVTDIVTETGICLTRVETAAAVLYHLESLLQTLSDRTFMEIYRKHSCTLGQRVQVILDGQPEICTAMDFTKDAQLVVKRDNGQTAVIYTGSATPV